MPFTGHETIGELTPKGDGLRIVCRGCGKITCYPFRLMREHAAEDDPIAFVLMRMRCETCQARVTDLAAVSIWRHEDDQPKGI